VCNSLITNETEPCVISFFILLDFGAIGYIRKDIVLWNLHLPGTVDIGTPRKTVKYPRVDELIQMIPNTAFNIQLRFHEGINSIRSVNFKKCHMSSI